MSINRIVNLLAGCVLLSACGGSEPTTAITTVSTSAAKVANSSGQFIHPIANTQFSGNVMVSITANDVDGLAAVYLQLGQSQQFVYLCQNDCVGNSFSATQTAINPDEYGATPGVISLSLWVVDSQNMAMEVDQIEIDWQPPAISNINAVRNVAGDQITLSWDQNPDLLRYNLYIASQSGVNKANYQQLTDGQAMLSKRAGPQLFTSLDPAKIYYLLLVGVDGSGESTNIGEVQIPVNGGIINDPPVAQNDSYNGIENQSVVIDAQQGLLANDSDLNGDPLTVMLQPVQQPDFGQLTLNADGSFEYIPDLDFSGQDQFIYAVSDDKGGQTEASVVLDITAIPADLLGNSSSITGELVYLGLGETAPGNNIGSGHYRIGNCIMDADTVCTMVGEYSESAQSGNNPNGLGSYAFILSYSGVGHSPVVARSQDAGSHSLTFIQTGNAVFELTLFPSEGGSIHATFPDITSQQLGFGAYITAQEVCQGLAPNDDCNIGRVGQVAGSSLVAPLDRLSVSIPGFALLDKPNNVPMGADDQYIATQNQTLIVDAPGVLFNDSDPDVLLAGDVLSVRNPLTPGLGQLVALGVDEYRQLLYFYPSFGNEIVVFDRSGTQLSTFPMQGESANDVDIDVAPVAFQLGNINIPQGSVLLFNGETGVTEIYAVDPQTGNLLTQLVTEFGASHVVGGTYNPVTGTFFLIQDNVPGIGGNSVAEIDPKSGAVLNSFGISPFNVSFGDIESNSSTGNLYLVSNVDNRIAEFSIDGVLLRTLPLPVGVSSISGIAVSAKGSRIWLASTSGNAYEVDFNNQGILPQHVVTLSNQPANGNVVLSLGGGFSYTPNTGFVGQDNFTYEIRDPQGGVDQAVVTVDVQ
ncbi:Ig-like domain-containing protein [Alteromonadaceae bacterium BrNp21-10]|nr:Ig-like domain-containing protein [Alteromonadaceae bacterium BrNp21-10]